jgi:hypothetical protein
MRWIPVLFPKIGAWMVREKDVVDDLHVHIIDVLGRHHTAYIGNIRLTDEPRAYVELYDDEGNMTSQVMLKEQAIRPCTLPLAMQAKIHAAGY